MGCGKTSVGRMIAARLSRRFADSDEAVEQKAGRGVAAIFQEEGEASFRVRESEALRELLADPDNLVLAAGGGAVLSAGNRRTMGAAGVVVYLRATADVLFARMTAKPEKRIARRPLLGGGGDLRARIGRLLAARRRRYLDAADIVVDLKADDEKKEVAARVLAALRQNGAV